MSDTSLDRLRQAVCQQLESLQAAGVRQLPQSTAPTSTTPAFGVTERVVASQKHLDAASPMAVDPPQRGKMPSTAPMFDSGAGEQSMIDVPKSTAATLQVLQQEVAGCTLCGELASTRTQTVFGVGNPRARLCILGEAPGADEDRQGEPFVGRAGQLLNKILEACRIKREEVYILNILKCRPPGNRNPLPEEAQNCRRYLDRQLELIDPEFICCLGAVAAQNLLATTEAIGKMRGKVLDYRGRRVVCTYHPAYLLRNPAAKKYTWDDMKFLMREMGTPVE